MNTKDRPYPFEQKARQYRAMATEALVWSLNDAWEAVRATPTCTPTENWYLADLDTIRREIYRRGESLTTILRRDRVGPGEPTRRYVLR